MEMPIRVVIVLFISVLIGLAIINFSTDLIGKSKIKLENFDEDENQADRIFELNNIDSEQIGQLANECFNEFENSLEDQICYAIIADVNANENNIIDSFNLDEDYIDVDLTNAKNAVKIKYNAIEGKVEVTG